MAALPAEYVYRTIPELLARASQNWGDRPAVSGGWLGVFRTLTFEQLDSASSRLAGVLVEKGLSRPGQAVAWSLGNDEGALALTLYHAVLKTGAYNVPLNARLSRRERNTLLQHSRARTHIVSGEEPFDGFVTVEIANLVSSNQEFALPEVEINEAALASVLYTSGTTGLPKGVEHTHGSSIASGIAWSDCFRLTRDDALQSPFPIVSGAGLHFNGLSSLRVGAHFIIDENSQQDTFNRIESFRTTVFVAVPSVYQFWLSSEHLASRDLSSLRILDYGGSSMPPSVAQKLRQLFPDAGLMQTYGFTEAGPGGTYLPEEYMRLHGESIGVRAAGRNSSFRVIDEHGTDVESGVDGELVFFGPSVMRGYHRDPEATAEVSVDGGGVRSGDIVRFDGDGFLYFVGRKRELIVRGGYNIAPVEIESVLLNHPEVEEAAVYSMPHPKLGEVAHGAVVLKPGAVATPIDLREHCARELADFKVPATIVVRADLPKNPTGKIMKSTLQQEAQGMALPDDLHQKIEESK